jgi:hypothetical protein
MNEHYMRLLTDIELNSKQKRAWYRVVEKFLGADHATQPTNFLDSLTSHRDELQGDDDFPFVYVVYLSDDVDLAIAENIVAVWDQIYPRDYQIESSAEYSDDCDDCDVEIDDAMHEEIQRRASKFLHNRWVESQLSEGWRFGLSRSSKDKTSPNMRDWDSLREEYRRELPMEREQAVKFFKEYPHLFV